MRKNEKIKRRGFVLIESIIYILLSTAIFAIVTPASIESIKCYCDSKDQSINMTKVEGLFIEIEKLLSRNNPIVTIEKNQIKLEYEVSQILREVSVLCKDDDKLKIYYYEIYDDARIKELSENTLSIRIDEVEFTKKNNLLYVTIVREGEKIMRCFYIKEKVKETY